MTVPELIDLLIDLDKDHPNREVHLLVEGRHLEVGAVEPWWDLAQDRAEQKHLIIILGVRMEREKTA